jgi:hypothetical protein
VGGRKAIAMTRLDQIDRAMRLTEAAGRAADKAYHVLLDLSADDLLVLPEKRLRQHYRLMRYYGYVLRDLSIAQDTLIMALPKLSVAEIRNGGCLTPTGGRAAALPLFPFPTR